MKLRIVSFNDFVGIFLSKLESMTTCETLTLQQVEFLKDYHSQIFDIDKPVTLEHITKVLLLLGKNPAQKDLNDLVSFFIRFYYC